MSKRKYIQGAYKPSNKYIGNKNNVIYRSSWELDAFRTLDKMDNIIRWSSEEICIPYVLQGPRGGQKVKRYFPDLYIEFRGDNGKIQKALIEIKPYKETRAPVPKQGKSKKTLLYEVQTYNMNMAKWRAARLFCQKKGWQFQVWTEKTLYPSKQKMQEEKNKLPKLKPVTTLKRKNNG